MNEVAITKDNASMMESVLLKGDLSQLTPQQRSHYYMKVCESVGLNPLTKPFEYITLNGKFGCSTEQPPQFQPIHSYHDYMTFAELNK